MSKVIDLVRKETKTLGKILEAINENLSSEDKNDVVNSGVLVYEVDGVLNTISLTESDMSLAEMVGALEMIKMSLIDQYYNS